jgi:hypothetical protein
MVLIAPRFPRAGVFFVCPVSEKVTHSAGGVGWVLFEIGEKKMQWFKHHGSFRNKPQMKYVSSLLGDHGVAAAYRLFEVMTERFGVDNDFSGSLLLSPPFTEHWLAQEICTPDEGHENQYHPTLVSVEQLHLYLSTFDGAGLIVYDTETGPGRAQDDKGTWQPTPEPLTFKRITLPGFVDLADEYTARKKSKGLSTPE